MMEGSPESSDQPEFELKIGTSESFEQISRQSSAVLCGSYQRGMPSLVWAYEKLSAAGMRVLSPSGLDFVAEVDRGPEPRMSSGPSLNLSNGSRSTASGLRIWSGSMPQRVT